MGADHQPLSPYRISKFLSTEFLFFCHSNSRGYAQVPWLGSHWPARFHIGFHVHPCYSRCRGLGGSSVWPNLPSPIGAICTGYAAGIGFAHCKPCATPSTPRLPMAGTDLRTIQEPMGRADMRMTRRRGYLSTSHKQK